MLKYQELQMLYGVRLDVIKTMRE